MNCDAALEAISAVLDGELSPDEQRELDAHLSQCPHCRALRDELAGLRAACAAGFSAQPPAELKEKIMADLPPQRTSKTRMVYWKRWGAMAAAVALVSLAIWQLPRSMRSVSSVPAAPAPAEETMLAPAEAPAAGASTYAVSGAVETPAEAVAEEYLFMDAQDMEMPVPTGTPENGAAAEDTLPSYVEDDALYINGVSSAKKQAILSGSRSSGATSTEDAIPTARVTSFAVMSASPVKEPEAETYGAVESVAEVNDEVPGSDNDAPIPAPAPKRGIGGWGGWTPETPTLAENDVAPITEADQEEVVPVELTTTFCGVLTLEENRPVRELTADVQENGDAWYYLLSQDFWDLVARLETEEAPHVLRTTGKDIDPDSSVGLVICPLP